MVARASCSIRLQLARFSCRPVPRPLVATLTEKVLPEKETDQPITGLLYFPMEAKQKTKDLELIYNGPAGKLSLRFR